MHAAESVEQREASNQNNTHNRLPRSGSPHVAVHLSSITMIIERESIIYYNCV